eukprot:CAMPEP_0194143106 /NCGR_PEP_ID=MMETSP0152-20130528/12300_1 /TAXON_ID=1049557 /ORGANISM="Thalassiothrix antarctica, Strain L6-D1" /LENGTH=1478 /DNA_ID=CAMNT_0038842361 /DNA_START=120 /DNA_END=4556 /DNA_ORIENTATION=+
MRWRPGPQNEVIDQDVIPDMPDLDHDEGVDSRVDEDRSDIPSRSRLGGSSTTSLPPVGVDSDGCGDEDGDTPEALKLEEANRADEEDDPGSDHAVDPQAPVPVWKPQNQQSTCEFTHTILNYSQKRESGCKKAEYSSTTIDEFGNRWRLIIYVNGNGRASNHHLSLFLQVADADDLPFGWKKAVSYVLTLEHPNGGNLGYAKRNPDKTFKLCPKAIDWGWSQFITSDRIQQEGYISNDSLTVRASVTVKSSSVNIDAEDAELYLKSAVEDGNAEAVKTCLSQGAGVNCQFKDDLYTPLHTACSSSSNSGSLEVLNLLLERGADGNACNKWRETPLLIAANNGHHAAVNALLENRADPSLCSEAGWSALTFAAHKGYNDIVTLLLKAGAPVNVRVMEDSSTPLHKACAGGKPGHLSAVKQLLENGADVHALNKWRETPLLTAANHGQADAVESLLKHGADPCKCTDTGWSPLSIAAYKGHDDVVRLLLEEGAPTEEADPTLSALLQAATKGLPDTVELLLRHGADHTVTTKKGDTALSILVEQNLIDAAVEMVTEYKASVPRCSRDRKKVQRAHLLIKLRVKQQQREGSLNISTDESETDEETDEYQPALNPSSSPSGKKKKKRKQKGSMESAEAQARAAEEALLLELEREESKAQKNEAIAVTKRAKKRKKKERERQQKLKEEQEQKEKEQMEADEREQQRKIQQEKDRKQREQRQKEQREKEMKETAARDRRLREAATKRKEKEKEKERLRREQEQKHRDKIETEKISVNKTNIVPSTSINSVETCKEQRISINNPKNGQNYVSLNQVSRVHVEKSSMSIRGWETNSITTGPALTQSKVNVLEIQENRNGSIKSRTQSNNNNSFSKTITTNHKMNNPCLDAVSSLGYETHQAPSPYRGIVSTNVQSPKENIAFAPIQQQQAKFELPQVVLCRQEKLGQLFQRCALARSQPHNDPLGSVSEDIIKTVLNRWIVRAAHDAAPFLDCMIPSWTDFDLLCSFLQRQFIVESPKSTSGIVNMEAMKEAGGAFARLCFSLAKDLVQFRRECEEQLAVGWDDNCDDRSLGLSGSEVMRNGMGSMICIDWANRAKVYFSTSSFAKATERYVGPSTRLLTALFAAKKRYEILGMLISGTPMDIRLTTATKESLTREANVKFECWCDPFSVCDDNGFYGCFEDVDAAFGGFAPFGRNDVFHDIRKLKRGSRKGGSTAVLPPLDNTVASLYIRRIVDLLESGDKELIPLSFFVILHAECFRDLSHSPSVNDAMQLDPRLCNRHGLYVRYAEILPAGQHSFWKGEGDGASQISMTGSVLLLLQNEAGKTRFALTEKSLLSIIHSMAPNGLQNPADASFTQMGYLDGYITHSPIPSCPPMVVPQKTVIHQTDFGGLVAPPLAAPLAIPFTSSNICVQPRTSRLPFLIDDGEEDNNIDVVSGMLNNFDGNLFKPTQDIDIEELNGMGFFGAPLADTNIAHDSDRTTSRLLG